MFYFLCIHPIPTPLPALANFTNPSSPLPLLQLKISQLSCQNLFFLWTAEYSPFPLCEDSFFPLESQLPQDTDHGLLILVHIAQQAAL